MALEFVSGALLSAFLQVEFDRLTSYQVLDFFHRRKLDETLSSKLKIKLLSIDALAHHAEQKQFRDQHVKSWLVAVKVAVLDAEDLLDDIDYELSKCKVDAESESQTYTCKVPNLFKSHVRSFDKDIKSRMEQLLDSLEFLSNQKGDLGLKNASGVGVGSGLGGELSHKSPSTSFLSESVFYGRDDDKEIILNRMISDTHNCNQLSILSIVGLGGLGKTMLAQHVYHHSGIEGIFDIKAWVCVSDEFDDFKVSRAILDTITNSADDSRELEMVHARLKEKLPGKRFLLVLDDVWNECQSKWEEVQKALDFGAQGSKILITTRSKKVASTMRSKEHHLKQLQEDYCWQLLAEHAFRDDNSQPDPDCKEIGMKIVEKCKGLPLALKTMGSLLHRKSVSEWKSVLQRELNLHGRLSIGELQNIESSSDASAVDLKNKAHLVELKLKRDGIGDQNPDDSTKERDVIVIENLQPSKHLEKLSIKNYGGMQFPSWLSDNSLWNVVSLSLKNCQSCQCLPSLGLLPSLKELTIERFDRIMGIDADFYGSSSSSFTSLETLKFSDMKEWEKWECQVVTGAFPPLQHLSIKGNCQCIFENSTEAWFLELIRQMISLTSSLERLYVISCPNMNIPMSGCHDFLISLMIIDGCDSLTTFPLDFFPTLSKLHLSGCLSLQRISHRHTHNNLKELEIWECPQLESLPERMHILLPSLDELLIADCPKLESFPHGGLPSNLKEMYLHNCFKLITSLKGALRDNSSLETLNIGKLYVESFPDEGLLPLSLLLCGSLIVQILKNWTTRVSATSHLSKGCFLKTAPASNAYQRRVFPYPFHIWKFGTVCCSNRVARNQKA
ncbi:putative disease resistance RPP13-like protein 1 [Glycine soja]